ncbi:exonuclease SbcCD subunit D C-terminal domain-containing protein [Treponema pedis]|uniref:Nuclease SbcCD subunit D n=1 Tax=Treponema pedis str. T A4 TaxID=1291379 RepID=S6A8E6_9SPIR|nr:exonuclease SbcCD subunit D C-terminal domain-containing protein [Treponema pedis]AGT43694.1 nuclease SbcCD subunit D [Treponema pedis str. T A4]
MKILHTADFHLGKNLYETSQTERQKKMLNDIYNILLNDNYAALIIAGDIYDRSIPSSEAVAMFDSFLSKIHINLPDTVILIIPGNHDSADRLSFGSQIFKMQNIHIAADTACLCTPVTVKQNNETVDFFLLPFLHLGSFLREEEQGDLFSIENKLDTQAAMAEEASRRLKGAVKPDVPSVLIAHFFTLNGIPSSSERAFLGTAEFVRPELFDFFSYTALGHLHKMQKITERMYYSGAPLTYSFDESVVEKVVLSVDINCNAEGFPVTIKKIPIEPLKKMIRLEGCFQDFFETEKFDEYKNDFLEINLIDKTVIKSPMSLLQKKFPYLLNIQQKSVSEKLKTEDKSFSEILKKNIEAPEIIFENFLNFENAIEETADGKKQNLFKEICGKALSEEV